MRQVNVHEGWEHDEESREKKLGRIIARVQYNASLDFFDGNNMTCGEMGRHLGITRLQDGRYVQGILDAHSGRNTNSIITIFGWNGYFGLL